MKEKKILNPQPLTVVRHTGWRFEDNDNYPCDVLIMEGAYRDMIFGHISNFWYWRRILDDGTLAEPEKGYGDFEISDNEYRISFDSTLEKEKNYRVEKINSIKYTLQKDDLQYLNNLTKKLHQFQVEAGFDNSDITLRLMLTASEIFEAFEAYRKDKFVNDKVKDFEWSIQNNPFPNDTEKHLDYWKEQFEKYIKDTMEDEIADAIIRLLGFCGENNVNIEWHILNKMKYNNLRGYKYGGKKF
ncbi:MAG: hypothetical protein ACOCVF_01025 [bacterium]